MYQDENQEDLLYEPHAISDSPIDISNPEQHWKPFRIEPCYICKKIPTIHKDFNFGDGDYRRYQLRCCSGAVGAHTSTLCIVRWNELNERGKDVGPIG